MSGFVCTSRQIHQASLSWAMWCDRTLPKTKMKGRHAKGITYERNVKKYLERTMPKIFTKYLIYSGAWIAFEDMYGHGFAQPDMVVELPETVILIEIKLTQTDAAEIQLNLLYRPLIEKLIPNKKIVLLQICKNLRYVPKNGLISNLCEMLDKEPGIIYTQHLTL